ncbi:MAG TPA: hypothetical protein VGL82_12535, partial [Bryobacteraceae bacterium]
KDGHPDLTGIWNPDGSYSGDFTKALKAGDRISMLPGAEKIMKSRKKGDDPANKCLPMGVPRLSTYPEKFVQTPSQIIILDEGDIHTFRIVYLNGRQHPAEVNPTWYGDSIGRWDGDTLVVDTIGFNDRTWLDAAGHPHTAQLHVTERYKRTAMNTMSREVTVDDPGAYAKPFTLEGSFKLLSNREIRERYCYKSPVDK